MTLHNEDGDRTCLEDVSIGQLLRRNGIGAAVPTRFGTIFSGCKARTKELQKLIVLIIA